MLMHRQQLHSGNSSHLPKRRDWVGKVLETAEAYDEVEALILEWKIIGTGFDKVNSTILPRLLESDRRKV